MNLLEEVSGKLPEDKEKMLAVIRKYQDLSESDRLIYRIGRRGGTYRSTDDLQHDPDIKKWKHSFRRFAHRREIRGSKKLLLNWWIGMYELVSLKTYQRLFLHRDGYTLWYK